MTLVMTARFVAVALCLALFSVSLCSGQPSLTCSGKVGSSVYNLTSLWGTQVVGSDSSAHYSFYLNMCGIAAGLHDQCTSEKATVCQVYPPTSEVLPATAFADDGKGSPTCTYNMVLVSAAGCPSTIATCD